MKKTFFRILTISLLFSTAFPLAAADGSIEATSQVNWITKKFVSSISLDTKKAEIQMPSGKKKASASIKTKMPQLIQNPLLYLFKDNESYLAHSVIDGELSSDQITDYIMSGYKTPDVFTSNLNYLHTTNTLNINEIGSYLVYHKMAYSPVRPIDDVPSRPYSGIIIDARGKNKVHGEFVSDNTYPCFFPVLWDENMNVIYEKSAADPEVIINNGMVGYHYSDDKNLYRDRIGSNPLYIKAKQVYGRNRTDPVIARKDALKILTVPENVKLLNEGKIVILLDKENLIYNVAVPEKDESYYVKFKTIKQYVISNSIPDVEVSSGPDGIVFSVNLNFYPDSPELLDSERGRIHMIADQLKNLLLDDGYTILVEGHTADVGKPVGQLNLSIERTETVMNALIDEGIERSLFTYKGYGGTMPIATNLTPEGRAENRRVNIIARPRQTYIQIDW